MTSISEIEPITANQKRTMNAFLTASFNQKSFIKDVQTELNRIAFVLSDDSSDSITIDGVTYDDKTSSGASLAISTFTSNLQSSVDGFNGLISSLDNVNKEIRQLVKS